MDNAIVLSSTWFQRFVSFLATVRSGGRTSLWRIPKLAVILVLLAFAQSALALSPSQLVEVKGTPSEGGVITITMKDHKLDVMITPGMTCDQICAAVSAAAAVSRDPYWQTLIIDCLNDTGCYIRFRSNDGSHLPEPEVSENDGLPAGDKDIGGISLKPTVITDAQFKISGIEGPPIPVGGNGTNQWQACITITVNGRDKKICITVDDDVEGRDGNDYPSTAEEIINAFRKAIEEDPDFAAVRNEEGQIFVSLNGPAIKLIKFKGASLPWLKEQPYAHPLLLAVAPRIGSVEGNEMVTVYGADLGPKAQIFFGEMPAEVLAYDETLGAYVVFTPPGPALGGAVDVVAIPVGWIRDQFNTLSQGFHYTPIPDPGTHSAEIDMFTTTPGASAVDFDANPIPVNFFGPGSEPFTNRVVFCGQPLHTEPPGLLGAADTIIRRMRPIDLGSQGFDVVPVEIVGLSLRSCEPITVHYQDGRAEKWNVSVALSSFMPQPGGQMTVLSDPCGQGGTFVATLQVRPRFAFSLAGDVISTTVNGVGSTISGRTERVLDFGQLQAAPTMEVGTANGHWLAFPAPGHYPINLPPDVLADHDLNPKTEPVGPLPHLAQNFFPGQRSIRCETEDCATAQPVVRLLRLQGQSMSLGLLPASYASDQLDSDGDGVSDLTDNCALTPNPTQTDSDDDGVGDVCDNCIHAANPCQQDFNHDGVGDACESPVPLRIQMRGTNAVVSWPATTPGPFFLHVTDNIVSPHWTLVEQTPMRRGDEFSVFLPRVTRPIFCTIKKLLCDCKNLVLNSITYGRVGFAGVAGGNTKVTMKFTVAATLTCDDTTKLRDVCEGKISWKLAGKSDWGAGVGVTDDVNEGSKIVTANCDGKPYAKTAVFEYQATVAKGRPVRGTVKIKITPECPIGTPGTARTVTVVIDSTANDGIDSDASDLDGDDLTGAEERQRGTDPNKRDTDGDGADDKTDNFPKDKDRQ